MNRSTTCLVLAALVAALAGCGNEDDPARTDVAGGPDGLEVPVASPDPADFVDTIDNPYLPLVPGTRWVYENTSSEGTETVVVRVLHETKDILGVRATVVRDTVTAEDGTLVEDTYDWFAQDRAGNVWYLGEYTEAYEDGKTTTEGSWLVGRDGAKAGIVMLADPDVGDAYAQEHYQGHAEDKGEVLALDASAKVPVGSYRNMVKTEDTTPLDPEAVEHKYYAKGVGFVFEEKVSGGDDLVKLVEMTRP